MVAFSYELAASVDSFNALSDYSMLLTSDNL